MVLGGCIAAALPLSAQSGVATQAVITVMPRSGKDAPVITAQQIKATVGDKSAQVSSWIPLRGERAGLQIVVLIDNSARSALTLEFPGLKRFIEALPEGTRVGVAYMRNGRAAMAQNITADRKLAAEALRIPSGTPGDNGSPYFCLSDLVKNWPTGAPAPGGDRREVLMITDGVDLYYGRSYNPDDPYVQAAITDAQRAGVLVHSIFYKDTGRFDNSQWTQAGAQSYLQQVSDGTGGRLYGNGFSNPVSFEPFLDDLQKRFRNQYELGLLARPRSKTELQQLKVKINAPGINVDAPQAVLVPGSEAPR
jgi:hypothetical protein